ncbi:thiamine-phosphate pyrophosphorylase [Helicobacter sp. 11S03491-1]|nr:thiamine-phosphate pyrophosphorylase [Helicobacter sp. 11S03491-1]
MLDANLNRLKEGIRVIEDTARYLQDDKKIASRLKNLRHTATLNHFNSLLNSRDSIGDVLKKTISSEAKRQDIKAIVSANFKRAQESSRVLEEYLKYEELKDFGNSEIFKNIRYELYEIEKEFILKYFAR